MNTQKTTRNMKRNFVWQPLFLSFGLAILLTVSGGEIYITQSEVVIDEMFSPALDGNLLNDPANRPMRIYLPPSYNVGNARYPVIYDLHGYTANHTMWVTDFGIHNVMDSLIKQGKVQEMLIIMPNAHNRYNGSWYANSSVAGNYEDYITQELVEFIDGKYRTLPQRGSRAIAGGSMGGFGAMKLAIKHPEVYSVVVSHCGVLSLGRWKWVPHTADPAFPAMAIAFSPNPDRPRLYDYPIDDRGQFQEDIWQRWLEHNPTTLAGTHQDNLKQLAGIYFDHGTIDTVVSISMARDFDKALTEAGIPHVYEEYVGDHTDKLPSRLPIALSFLSGQLSSEIMTPVHIRGKLAATWGQIKQNQ